MYELWENSIKINAEDLKRPADIKYIDIHKTFQEDGQSIFLHGVAIAKFKDTFFVNWANNWVAENTKTELIRGKRSKDAINWSHIEQISPVNATFAASHAVYLQKDGSLYSLGAHFYGPTPEECFSGLRCDSYRYDEDKDQFVHEGSVAENVWPMAEPIRMSNGNYLLCGCNAKWLAAVAISNGSDIYHWSTHNIEVGDKVYTEATAWAFDNEIMLIMRNQTDITDGLYNAAIAISKDYGQTFGPCMLTNLPMVNSKPYTGRLTDGRNYLIYNYPLSAKDDRNCLVIALTQPGGKKLSKIYELDRWQPGLAYPYAIEEDGNLYVTYSARCAEAVSGLNINDAKLAIVPIASL